MSDFSGSTNSWKRGQLKRTLPTVVLAALAPDAGGGRSTEAQTWRARLRGISANLHFHIAVALVQRDGKAPVPMSLYANTLAAGSMQVRPVVSPDDAPPLGLRPVFQDPTLVPTNNLDHSMAQALPYGWEYDSCTDEAIIDVTFDVNANLPMLADFEGQLVLVVQAEYVGAWWQPDVIQYLLGQVNVTQVEHVQLNTLVA